MLLVCCRHLICCRFMVDLWIHCTTNWGNGVRAFKNITHTHTHTHPFNGPFSGNTQVSRYQKGKPIWILLKQEIVSGNGISWAISKSAPCSRQITMPAPHHSASKHWRQKTYYTLNLSERWLDWNRCKLFFYVFATLYCIAAFIPCLCQLTVNSYYVDTCQ